MSLSLHSIHGNHFIIHSGPEKDIIVMQNIIIECKCGVNGELAGIIVFAKNLGASEIDCPICDEVSSLQSHLFKARIGFSRCHHGLC